MRRLLDALCFALLFAFAVVALRVTGQMIVDAGGWKIVRKLNQDSGDLLAAIVAASALGFAYREYKIRNSPVFYLRQELRWMGDDEVIIEYSVKSEFERPIVLREMRFTPEDGRGVEPKFQDPDFILLPGREMGVALFVLQKSRLSEKPLYIEGFLTGVSSADDSLYSSLRVRTSVILDGKIPRARIAEYAFLPRVDRES